ncbi:MAG: phage holin family protein [Micrococcales bacterium]|nr:phage holin family protein [Micrococcales bacterium]
MTSQNSEARSLGELFASVSEQSARLVRAEIELAKAELAAKAKRVGAGVGMFGAAASLAFWAVGALVATLILVLAIWLPAWAAALIVTGTMFVTIALLVLFGKNQVEKGSPPVPEAAIASIKEDLEAVKKGVQP